MKLLLNIFYYLIQFIIIIYTLISNKGQYTYRVIHMYVRSLKRVKGESRYFLIACNGTGAALR